MRCAVVTGASSGLGEEYARRIAGDYPDIERVYLVARRLDRLEALARSLAHRDVVPLALDLSSEASFAALSGRLAADGADIRLLVNNAGYGKLGELASADRGEQCGMVDVNCRALTAVTRLALPFMQRGAAIVQVCSIAAFVPTPHMAVYSATKAYVFSLSKALRSELKPLGINVLAVCPGPMNTEFLPVAGFHGQRTAFDFLPRVQPARMAEQSLKRAFAGKAVYTGRAVYKVYRVLAKLVPHNWLMKLTTI